MVISSELEQALRDCGIHTAEDLDAWLLARVGTVVDGLRLTLVGIRDGQLIWQFTPTAQAAAGYKARSSRRGTT